MNFVAHLDTPNLHYLQQWTGTFLAHMTWESNFESLAKHQNKIMIIDAVEANYRIITTQNLVNNGNFLIVCDFFSSQNDGDIGNLIARLDISETQYAVICSSCSSHPRSINLNEFYHSQLSLTNRLRAQDLPDASFDKTSKPYKFLFTNTSRTKVREKLWKKLHDLGLLQHALWSWEHFRCGPSKNYDPCSDIPITFLPDQYESPFADLDRLQQFREDRRKAFRLSTDGFFRAHWSRTHLIPQQFVDTYFRVICERDVENVFVTAYAYNSLLAGQPLLVVAAPGYLQYLRDLGFRTWHGIIDESYDNLPDVDSRIAAVLHEVQRLCEIDLDKWLQSCRDIAYHNQNHYINYQWQHWRSTHTELERLFSAIEKDWFQI